tara:strand:- start:762 stop:1535 length:774 start_codon:yes stop_codon:yes gene_type:complete
MSDKNKLKKISAELKKASKMHAAQAKKIGNMSKGASMLGIIPNVAGNLKQNLRTQGIAENLFQGQALAEQMQARRIDKPIMPPAPDPKAPLYLKKVVKEQPRVFKDTYMEKTPQVAIEPTKKIYKEMTERVVREVPKEMTGLQREQRMYIPEEKMEKPREMPRQVIQRVNMEGPLAQNGDPKKYRMPLEGVQDLQDMGAVKEDKKGQYVVNITSNPKASDTLRFPKGTTHFSGKRYKKGQLIDETDYEDIIKKVNKS